MKHAFPILNALVAASLTFASVSLAIVPAPAARAQTAVAGGAASVDELLRQLADADAAQAMRLERQILRIWSRSGSDAIDYLFSRGQQALQDGRAEDAIEHFSAVIDHDPEFAEAWNGRASAYFMLNRLGQSMADIEQALIRNPSHFGALAGLGMILEQLGRPEAALRAYRASLAIHPHQAAVLEAVARLELASAGAAL